MKLEVGVFGHVVGDRGVWPVTSQVDRLTGTYFEMIFIQHLCLQATYFLDGPVQTRREH